MSYLKNAETSEIITRFVSFRKTQEVISTVQTALDGKQDREKRTGSETLYKVLTDNNFTDEAAEQLAAAFAALHEHANKALLDGLTQDDQLEEGDDQHDGDQVPQAVQAGGKEVPQRCHGVAQALAAPGPAVPPPAPSAPTGTLSS